MLHIITRTFVQSAIALGHRKIAIFASPAGTMGVGINDVNAFNGRRCSSSSYLKMAGACRPLIQRFMNDDCSLAVWLARKRVKWCLTKRSTKRAVAIDVAINMETTMMKRYK